MLGLIKAGSEHLGVTPVAGMALFAYLLGSVPFALLLGRLRGVDIRRVGSGNIGATNLGRALGRRWGLVCFALDFLKGLLPVLVVGLAPLDASQEGGIRLQHAQMACGLGAVLGHVFPVYLRFRGGKGVATSFGALTGLAPAAALAAGVIWAALYFTTKIVAVASIVTAIAFPVATFVTFRNRPGGLEMELLALGLAVLIVIRHQSNIRRLFRGEEKKF